MDCRMGAGRHGEWGFKAVISHHLLSQITLFSHRISHSFPNELNGLRAESHLFKPDEVGQKIDLPGGLICAHVKLDRCYVNFFSPPFYCPKNRCDILTAKGIVC